MASPRKRKELEHLVGFVIGRELGARSILFHQAIANLAGVSVTDLKCLDYVDRMGDVTAGDLARLTGLTTGAITAAIDRLEKAGLARRERSETDRRKVFIRLCQSPAMARIAPFYEALGRESAQMVTRYSTAQLETIKDFCERCIEIMRRQTEAVLNSKKNQTIGGRV
jgi:predicted ArsR family transcriptional regulator